MERFGIQCHLNIIPTQTHKAFVHCRWINTEALSDHSELNCRPRSPDRFATSLLYSLRPAFSDVCLHCSIAPGAALDRLFHSHIFSTFDWFSYQHTVLLYLQHNNYLMINVTYIFSHKLFHYTYQYFLTQQFIHRTFCKCFLFVVHYFQESLFFVVVV